MRPSVGSRLPVSEERSPQRRSSERALGKEQTTKQIYPNNSVLP